MKHSQLIESLVKEVRELNPEQDVAILKELEEILLWKSTKYEKPPKGVRIDFVMDEGDGYRHISHWRLAQFRWKYKKNYS